MWHSNSRLPYPPFSLNSWAAAAAAAAGFCNHVETATMNPRRIHFTLSTTESKTLSKGLHEHFGTPIRLSLRLSSTQGALSSTHLTWWVCYMHRFKEIWLSQSHQAIVPSCWPRTVRGLSYRTLRIPSNRDACKPPAQSLQRLLLPLLLLPSLTHCLPLPSLSLSPHSLSPFAFSPLFPFVPICAHSLIHLTFMSGDRKKEERR